MEEGRVGGREGGREGGMEGGRAGGREVGMEGGRDGHGRSIASDQLERHQHERRQLRSWRRQIEPKRRKATSKNGDNKSLYLHGLKTCG